MCLVSLVSNRGYGQPYAVKMLGIDDDHRLHGGLINVEGSEIDAWNVTVIGEFPFTFSSALPGHQVSGDATISDDAISFSMTGQGSPRTFRFESHVLPAGFWTMTHQGDARYLLRLNMQLTGSNATVLASHMLVEPCPFLLDF